MKNSELEAKMQEISRLVHRHRQYFLGVMVSLLVIMDALLVALIDRIGLQNMFIQLLGLIVIANMHMHVEVSLRQLTMQLKQSIIRHTLSAAAVLSWPLVMLEASSPTLRVPILSNCIDYSIILWLMMAAFIMLSAHCCEKYPQD